MTSNNSPRSASNYAYYSFPPTPTRTTPSPSTRRGQLSFSSQTTSQIPSTVPKPDQQQNPSSKMASPAVSKQQAPASTATPSTPTKLSRKPVSTPQQQQKAGQSGGSKPTPSAPRGTPSTPKTGGAAATGGNKKPSTPENPIKSAKPSSPGKFSNASGKPSTPGKVNAPGKSGKPSTPGKPSTGSLPGKSSTPGKPSTGSLSGKPQDRAAGLQGAAKNKADNAKQQAEQTAQKAKSEQPSKLTEKTESNDDENDDPLSEISPPGSQQSAKGLKQAIPEPISDDDDEDALGEESGEGGEDDDAEDNDAEDAVSGAQQKVNQATDGAIGDDENDDEEDDAATEKAGGESTTDDQTTTTDDLDQQQEQEQPKQQPRRGGGLLKGAQGLAGKASGLAGKAKSAPQNAAGKASKATQDPSGTAQETAEEAKSTAEDAKDGVQEAAEGAQDDAEEGLDEAKKVAGDATDEAGNAAEDAAEGAQDAAEDAAEGAQETAENAAEGVQDAAEDTAEDAQDTFEDAAENAQGAAEDATEGVQDTAEDAAEGAEDAAEDAKEGVQDTAEDATGQDLPDTDAITRELPQPPEGLPLDLSILKGLEVQEDGTVVDSSGNAIGKLAEGDAEDLEGYPIGDDGEILDDDGDLVGRVELLPDEIKRQISEARDQGTELPDGADEYLEQLDQAQAGEEGGENSGEQDEEEGEGHEDEDEDDDGPQLPGLSIMDGLTCQVDGLIYDSEGNTIGKVVEGEAEDLQNATLNDQGEFLDEEGNVVGRAEIHEDAAELVEQGLYEAAGQAQDAAEDLEGQVEDAADEAAEAGDEAGETADGIEDQLPGIEALEGRELNEVGDIVDEGGNLLGVIEDEELKQKIADGEIDPDTLTINEAGEVVDEDGNVLGKTELAEGAAERLAGGPLLDVRILEGKKVNKKGQILDEDGEVIGELRDGELSDCAGKKVNEKGEVFDKSGNLVGHVNVVAGEASQNATHELLEELGELTPENDEAGDDGKPDLSILDGLKVNKKGQILNEDGEPTGELTEGELSDCTGKKVNDKGEVLDKEGNVIGHVQTLAPETEDEQPEEEEEDDDSPQEEEEEEEDQLPPLSILEGLTCNKAGKLIDDDGHVVGELVEGDPKKLSKSGNTCDDQGQFWDNKGHVIGRAQTLPREDAEDEAPFAGLEGLHVVEEGYVEDEGGHRVGYVTEGDWKKLLGRTVDEDGDVLDKKGSVVGHADRYEEADQEEPEADDLSFLQGKTVNKAGVVIGDEGVPVARLVEGKPKDLAGKKLDDKGQLWNDRGQVVGRIELIPEEEREAKPEGPFAGLEDLRVIEGGKVADESGNVVGEIVEGNPKRLIGLSVDEDGDILDRYGNVKGHAEPLPEEEEEAEADNSILSGKTLNKQGYVVDENGTPFGRLVEGDAKELAGRRCDENGLIYNDVGKSVGRCEVIPENERVARPEGPFAGLEGLRVVKEGWVEDEEGNRVGQLVEGNAKRLVGLAVDEDGDIIDKYGNVKGHAEPWEEPDEEQVDLSALNGCTINKSGNAVDNTGAIVGRVVEGDVKSLVGKKVDGQGQIWDNAGNVVGRCELVYGEDTSPDGPFAGFESLQIQKDGTITMPSGDIVGRVIEGDIKKLMGHKVDDDGDIVDKNGNTIGKAERWEPEEKQRNVNPMSGRRVNRDGEVRDENGDLIGKLTEGSLGHCVGQEIDDSGNVVDVDGNKIGEVTLIENIDEEEYEGPSEAELEEARKRDEERQIAEKMGAICQQTLERVQPVCKQITEHMEKADRTPKDELDEEELVNNVKPLIEEGGRILQECNGSLRGLDPDGKIAAQAKGRAGTGEATPEEHRLADTLKEITTTVVTTIDNAKKKLNDMPHAKKKLNPLWSLLTQPLFQILAAVGLLLAGVLGLVGQLLNALGLGGLVNGLMGGLGINKLLESFGLIDGEKDKKNKKKGGSGLSNIPIVGGLLGGGK